MQYLQARHRIAVRIVRMQAERKFREREIIRVRNSPNIKDASVISVSNPADHGSDFEDSRIFRRHSRKKRNADARDFFEPFQAHRCGTNDLVEGTSHKDVVIQSAPGTQFRYAGSRSEE